MSHAILLELLTRTFFMVLSSYSLNSTMQSKPWTWELKSDYNVSLHKIENWVLRMDVICNYSWWEEIQVHRKHISPCLKSSLKELYVNLTLLFLYHLKCIHIYAQFLKVEIE